MILDRDGNEWRPPAPKPTVYDWCVTLLLLAMAGAIVIWLLTVFIPGVFQ